MPSDNVSDLESVEAFKAALEVDAGLAEWVFRELATKGSPELLEYDSPLFDYIRKSDIHLYNDIVRIGSAWIANQNMRNQQTSFELKAKKIHCPRHGRLGSVGGSSRFDHD